jgi:hypothetical protein
MADTQVVDLVHLGSFHFPFSSHFGRGLAEIVFTILLLADFLSFAFSLSSTYLIESCSISPSQSPFLSSSTPLSLYLPLSVLCLTILFGGLRRFFLFFIFLRTIGNFG